jgi:hypothetical protein
MRHPQPNFTAEKESAASIVQAGHGMHDRNQKKKKNTQEFYSFFSGFDS